MSRISEKSYRRGFQHGTLGIHTINVEDFRFNVSLDKSPFTHGPKGRMTAIERLFLECGSFREIGFWKEYDEQEPK